LFILTFILAKVLERRESKNADFEGDYYKIHGDGDIFENQGKI